MHTEAKREKTIDDADIESTNTPVFEQGFDFIFVKCQIEYFLTVRY